MRTVILDGMESENVIENTLNRMFEKRGEEFSCFKLKDMNILPCRSCGACGHKTPGKCVINDDMPEILRAVATSRRIVMITPLRFGGYSSQLKKAVDKFMVLGIPLYIVKDGHLLHPMRYGSKFILVIGLAESKTQGQEEAFKTLVANNALNMVSTGKTLIFNPSDDLKKIEHEIGNALREGVK